MITTNTCLRYLITDQSHEILNLYNHYQKGLLPFGGGLYDQPALYKKMMDAAETAINNAHKPEDKK